MTTDGAPPAVGLLFGYGSVGRLHARALAAVARRIVVVDADAGARARAAADHPAATVAADLPSARAALPAPSDVLAVIATWGPSHARLFHELADLGVRRILCEKPLATSVAAADAMAGRAAREGIALTSHHYFRTSGLVEAFARFADEHRLGEPVAIAAIGGAACLATSGLHWVDLARVVFGAGPTAVVSTARDDRINPRAPDLGFYGGTAVWTFERGRELTLGFSNASSVYPVTVIHYRDAALTLDYDYEVVVSRRDADEVARGPAVTRTGPPRQVLFKGQAPGVVDGLTALTTSLTRLWAGDVSAAPPADAVAAVNGTIGALIAGREGRCLALPIAPDSAHGREEWPIS